MKKSILSIALYFFFSHTSLLKQSNEFNTLFSKFFWKCKTNAFCISFYRVDGILTNGTSKFKLTFS